MSAVIYYCNFEIPGRKRAAYEIVENVPTLLSISDYYIYLGDLRNLIGSLSRTIQQYSHPSEWLMCELCVSQFFRERSFKSRQNPRVDFFLRQEKTSKDSKRHFSIYCKCACFLLNGLFTTPIYSRRRGRFVNSACPNKKHLAPKSKFIYDKPI